VSEVLVCPGCGKKRERIPSVLGAAGELSPRCPACRHRRKFPVLQSAATPLYPLRDPSKRKVS
jgi:hypothetical protein